MRFWRFTGEGVNNRGWLFIDILYKSELIFFIGVDVLVNNSTCSIFCVLSAEIVSITSSIYSNYTF